MWKDWEQEATGCTSRVVATSAPGNSSLLTRVCYIRFVNAIFNDKAKSEFDCTETGSYFEVSTFLTVTSIMLGLCQLGRSSSSAVKRATQCRGYAMWVEEPQTYSNRNYPRTYNPQSVALKNNYLDLLNRRAPLLFLRHEDFKAKDLIRLRSTIRTAATPGRHAFGIPIPSEGYPSARLLAVRKAALGVALRECTDLSQSTRRKLKGIIGKGSLFILELPSLEPPHILSLIRNLEKAVPSLPPRTSSGTKNTEPDADFVPGKLQPRLRPLTKPSLQLLGALVEGQAMPMPQLQQTANLPPLAMLHSQIVGFLSSPASQLAGILSQAGGGQLLRTLQGYQKGLEESKSSST
jgi:hypothetical protein